MRIFQTQTSHDPYIVQERATYQAKLRNHLRDNLGFECMRKLPILIRYRRIYMTLLYADDAVKGVY